MEKQFFTMDDFDFGGKTALVRADLNCPYDERTGRIEDSERIAAHSRTVSELLEKRAKVVVLAHQGRKGDPDFLPLLQHAALLSKHLGTRIEFVDDLYGPKALSAISSLRPGSALLLQNTRFFETETTKALPEEYAKSEMVGSLGGAADYFINDAFSVSHRSQASITGFPEVLPSAAGRVMERELEGLRQALDNAAHPNIYVLGGAKPDDVFQLLKFACASAAVDKVLTSGVLGELCAAAAGAQLGEAKMKFFREKGYGSIIPELKQLLAKCPGKVEIPEDAAVEENGQRREYAVAEMGAHAGSKQTSDIGEKTISRYAQMIKAASTIYFKGPVGVYENPLFEKGTREILLALQASSAFKLMGGGHSLSAVEKFGIDKARISHISLAGGAVVEYLQGKELPGVAALRKAYSRDKGKFRNEFR